MPLSPKRKTSPFQKRSLKEIQEIDLLRRKYHDRLDTVLGYIESIEKTKQIFGTYLLEQIHKKSLTEALFFTP
jgi:hypothetical protein